MTILSVHPARRLKCPQPGAWVILPASIGQAAPADGVPAKVLGGTGKGRTLRVWHVGRERTVTRTADDAWQTARLDPPDGWYRGTWTAQHGPVHYLGLCPCGHCLPSGGQARLLTPDGDLLAHVRRQSWDDLDVEGPGPRPGHRP